MSAKRGTRFGNRWVGGSSLACALVAAGALVASCSSSNEGLTFPSFVPEDCRGGLVELARFRRTYTVTPVAVRSAANDLALEGETLFMTYAFAGPSSELPASGGIVAVPVSGGAARVVAAAQNTSQWHADSFWVSGGRIYLQTGSEILSFPVESPTPSVLPGVRSGLYGAYAHDAEFGYAASIPDAHLGGLTITKTPWAGGVPTVLFDESMPNAALGGMADDGDAVLLLLRWHPEPTYSGKTFTRVWRIPKDGAPRGDVRPDLEWADALYIEEWLAWDGANILGPIMVRNHVVIARVPAAGPSPPEYLKLGGNVATRRGDEILSLQMVQARGAQGSTPQLLVASSKGAPAGSVVACGTANPSVLSVVPRGIAADDSAVYVSYREDDDTVIARVSP